MIIDPSGSVFLCIATTTGQNRWRVGVFEKGYWFLLIRSSEEIPLCKFDETTVKQLPLIQDVRACKKHLHRTNNIALDVVFQQEVFSPPTTLHNGHKYLLSQFVDSHPSRESRYNLEVILQDVFLPNVQSWSGYRCNKVLVVLAIRQCCPHRCRWRKGSSRNAHRSRVADG